MLSEARLRRYREMTPSERWAETAALMRLAWEALSRLPARERERRLALLTGRRSAWRPPRARRGATRERDPQRPESR